MQKPYDIKKNKPKTKNNERQTNEDEDDDVYYDEFGNPSVDPDDPFGKRKNTNYNRNSRNNSANSRNPFGGSAVNSSRNNNERASGSLR